MPVKQERLIILIAICVLGYLSLKEVMEEMFTVAEEPLFFHEEKISETTNRYVSLLTNGEFWTKIQEDPDLIQQFVDILMNNDFDAYFFETPCLNQIKLGNQFEFVLKSGGDLVGLEEDKSSFQSHFTSKPAVSFVNLGGDAELVCPNPLFKQTDYAHLAVFVRTAPSHQVQELIKFLGISVLNRIKSKGVSNVWVSTSGLGVSWLHFRLDSYPKYYQHSEYKSNC